MSDVSRFRALKRIWIVPPALSAGASAVALVVLTVSGGLDAGSAVAAWCSVLAVTVVGAIVCRALADRAKSRAPDPNRHPLDAFALTRPTALLALENAPDPALLVDAEGRIRLVNAAARDFLGRDALGKRVSAVFRSPVVLAACEDVLNGGKSRAVEYSLLVPVERHLRANVALVAPRDVPGLPADERRSALVMIQDLTSQRRAERMQSDFVANASHELRTPLSALKGFIETLQGPAREDDVAREKFLAIMAAQAARMERLIDGLLSLSRIELYEHVPPQDAMDLAEALRDATDGYRLMEPAAAARVRLSLAAHDDFSVIGARDEIIQVAHNLIGNAAKYGGSGPIEVGLGLGDHPVDALGDGGVIYVGDMAAANVRGEALRDYRYVRVRDFGAGIARESLPRLTERFFRVEGDEPAQGSGLGLAIVKHIVNRHQGVLKIESRPGAGSAFTVFLPPALDAAASEGRAEASKASGPAERTPAAAHG